MSETRGINYHQFDVHIAHTCNFFCDSCSHFSNYHFPGVLSLEEAELWYKNWAPRLRPFKINLLGGEPAINPHLCAHISLARKCWPHAALVLYTNGFLLHKHPKLPLHMQEAGNCLIRLSRHFDSTAYNEPFDAAVKLLIKWKDEHQVPFDISDSYSKWTRRYIDDGKGLSPFMDNNPRQSWEICNARYCLQLHEGKLWKCPILAYLSMAKEKPGLSPDWDPYLLYRPLEYNCSNSELEEFLARRDEPYCAACPSYKRPFEKSNPLKRR